MSDKKIEIIEVGPRDGFQNVPDFIPTEYKLKVIDGIIRAGIKSVQITSFVSPKAIPQMKDAKEIAFACLDRYPDSNLFALVPNMYGAKLAVECGIKEIYYVISVSETHNFNNVRKSHDESFMELSEIQKLYPYLKINLDVATAFGCHFEGDIPIEKTMAFLKRAHDIGISSFNLCDTVGLAHPMMVERLVDASLSEFRECEFQIHIHDTRNMGIINSYKALERGITKIQTSIGGLGGCPFAPGASGNTSTEDFVYMLNRMGFNTGIDVNVLIEVALDLKEHISGNYSGHQVLIDKDHR